MASQNVFTCPAVAVNQYRHGSLGDLLDLLPDGLHSLGAPKDQVFRRELFGGTSGNEFVSVGQGSGFPQPYWKALKAPNWADPVRVRAPCFEASYRNNQS